ncbi:MAG: NUDIX domain-containing protein [Candidatus Uhrbacteria bacterium]|nr:NUDIX domain-containing protein [Patescibacteria group bacterium]MBU1906941.1 NUDIX domain-containing protein [Patescibacteria group bacterium]
MLDINAKHLHQSAGGAVFCLKEGELRVALIKIHDGGWMLPKGHLELGETPVETAVREIGEELGISRRLRCAGKIGLDTFSYRLSKAAPRERKEVQLFAFLIDKPIDLTPLGSEKFTKARWFKLPEAKEKLAPSIYTVERSAMIDDRTITDGIDQAILAKAERLVRHFLDPSQPKVKSNI